MTPNSPEADAVIVITKVLCFSKKSGSGHAALTQSIGQMVVSMYIHLLYIFIHQVVLAHNWAHRQLWALQAVKVHTYLVRVRE